MTFDPDDMRSTLVHKINSTHAAIVKLDNLQDKEPKT